MAFCNNNCPCGESCVRQDDHGGDCDCRSDSCSFRGGAQPVRAYPTECWVVVDTKMGKVFEQKVFLQKEDAEIVRKVATLNFAPLEFKVERFRFMSGEVQEIDLDGFVDAKGVKYIGKAGRRKDGTWECLADVAGSLCRVQVTITAKDNKPV